MRKSARIRRDFLRISADAALVTATDARHAPYLFNAMASIHERFPDHPTLFVFDLGMTRTQRKELAGAPWVEIKPVENFVEHWKQNWSWKPYILTQTPRRYLFYFDASNIVLFRPLTLWFGAIQRRGYLFFENGQRMRQIVPSEYWALFGCSESLFADAPTFGAGLMGFDRGGFAGDVIDKVLSRTIEGWTLGRSAQETRRAYDRSVIRDCESFRADQTLFNLAFRKHCGDALVLRDELKYCGHGGPADSPRQYLWYSRRQRKSLIYFWRPVGATGFIIFVARVWAYMRIIARDQAILMVRGWLNWMR